MGGFDVSRHRFTTLSLCAVMALLGFSLVGCASSGWSQGPVADLPVPYGRTTLPASLQGSCSDACSPAPRAATCCEAKSCCAPPLPCERQRSLWSVRGLGGRAFFEGTDAADACNYWGADLGRTFCCSCWGLDAFYRQNSGSFDRRNPTGSIGSDSGDFHHVGVKLTFQDRLGNSRWFAWGGIGPSYFWTSEYLANDSGFGVFAEAGLGYQLNQHLRLRAGLNAHGMNTSVGRLDAADDNSDRWLWILAPVLGAELSF